MGGKWILIALAAVASMVAMTEAVTNHVVGGSSTGWTIPSTATVYSQWAAGQTFVVGDTLLFNFSTGLHNVIKVPKSSYDSCSAKNQIGSTLTTGPATVTITAPGNHYYICGVSGHCSIGQKLAISVSSPAPTPSPKAASPAPTPAPKAASPATSVSPSSGSGVAPAASSPAPATGGPPPSSSTGTGGTSTGPSASSPSDNHTPTVAAGPSGSGPSTGSASSSLLSSGYLTSFATAALLSATTAFLL